MTVILKQVPKESVEEIWPQIDEWVKNAIGKDKAWSSADVMKACIDEKLRLWIISTDKIKGFVITLISQSPGGKTCYLPWLGGEDLHEWVPDGFEKLKEWIKSQGCISFSWMGRMAWKKLVKADYEGVFYLINL